MFAKLLLDQEKKGFLELLYYLSRIDGQVSKCEIDYIKAIASEIDVDFSELINNGEKEIKIDEILRQMISPMSKRIVILELINIAFTDRNYTVPEKQGIRVIASILGVDENEIKALEEWVAEGIKWSDLGLTLISEGGK